MICVLNISFRDENCFSVYDGITFDFFYLLFLCPSDQSEVSWSRFSANESPPCPPTAPQVLRPSCSSQSAPCTCSAHHSGSMSSWQTTRQHTSSYGRFREMVCASECLHIPLLSGERTEAFSVPVLRRRRRRGINVSGLVCANTLPCASESRTSMPTAPPKPWEAC